MYLLMIDYGRSREAVCNPEHTRRDIVAEVRDLLAKPRGRSVAFVKFIDGNFIEDVTADIMDEVETEIVSEGLATMAEREMARRDHARDLRKHEAV